MSDRLIFLSCGQSTVEEKQIGRTIVGAIDSHEGFKAYFADSVQDLTALGNHVFDALRRCAGAIILLHSRSGERSSLWINQEIAVLAYRKFLEAADIPILLFKDQAVSLEGAMTALIMNPKPLGPEETILEEVHRWMKNEAVRGRVDEQDIFDAKWGELIPYDHAILKALIEEGCQNGHSVQESSVRHRLKAKSNTEFSNFKTRRLLLKQKNLIELHHDDYGEKISLHPSWEWYIRREVRRP